MSSLSALQRAYVLVAERRDEVMKSDGEAAAITVLALGDVLGLMKQIDPDADAGLDEPLPGASYGPKPYDRFDSPELQELPGA